MATFTGTEFNDLAKLLFNCLRGTNPNFNPWEYMENFDKLQNNVSRVAFVLSDIQKYPKVFAKFTRDEKSDETALSHYEKGRLAFNNGNYWDALEDYTRCIAIAKNPRVLAMGYRNRAECFVELKMREQGQEDVSRASSHSLDNELNDILKKLNRLESRDYRNFESIPDVATFSKNPSIQSGNDCIKLAYSEKYNRDIIVASRDIQIGEIISIEKPYACVLTTDRLSHCHECLNLCYNLIPCNNCSVALFCSELCKEKAHFYHKYECPVLLTICYRALCEFFIEDSMLLALKIALLAKNEVLEELQLDGTYQSDRFNEIYLLPAQVEFSRFDIFHQAILTAFIFDLFSKYTSLFSAIFATVDTQIRFKEVMMMQLQKSQNAVKNYEYVQNSKFCGTANFGFGAYSLFSLFPHSCCANVMKTYHGNVMVLRALNTIKDGEICFVNRFGLRYDSAESNMRLKIFTDHKISICGCLACENNWVANLGRTEEICEKLGIAHIELGQIVRELIGSDVTKAGEFLPKFMEQLKDCEDSEPEGNALALKNLIVHCYVIYGNKKIQVGDNRDVTFEL